MGAPMLTAMIAGTVSLIIAILSSLISIITNKLTLMQAQQALWQSGVTENRMKWIAEVRNITSLLLSYEYKELLQYPAKYSEFKREACKLKLYLNFAGDMDFEIIDTIDRIFDILDINNDEEIFSRTVAGLEKCIKIYLKSEWERVKFETAPNNLGRSFDEKASLDALTKRYEESEALAILRPTLEAFELRKQLAGAEDPK